ncbi:hypothetical protein [Candidatus Venteria ishoeyi]|uniref:Uncharacterized protein n=1 Tax=Candidatus Venteria ishoeyi TaxID=1899563 RepID=A0A1H6F580_9GAMM|nr:hypothetical protein [Candidatus Venteria ishoeyi]SEH04541.1 Uncharacterised protein [Candidatus Venteria ishoeyi]
MSLYFSEYPGCWERNLQRRYNNPLFSIILSADNNNENTTPVHIDQPLVNEAQRKDEAERIQFTEDFNALLEQVVHLKSKEQSELIFDLKDKIDRLYEYAAGLGSDFSAEKAGLKKLNLLIMQSIQQSGEHDPKALEEIKKETQARTLHFNLLEYPLVAHLLRPDTPIHPEDLVPTLLSEEESSLRAAMSLFDPEHCQIICDTALALIQQLEQAGKEVSNARIRLAMMAQSLSQS